MIRVDHISPSRRRRLLFALISCSLSIVVGLTLCEVAFRILERRENARTIYTGNGGMWIKDPRWGWKPSLGTFRSATSEFDVTGNINSLYMNDISYDAKEDESRTRVFVLGDSHTYAVGVSMQRTWAKLLEGKLNPSYGANTFRT